VTVILIPGDRVRVRGLPGNFTVTSLERNGDVTVFGGKRGRMQAYHSVTRDRVIRRRNQAP
jgi:hypothetical protein